MLLLDERDHLPDTSGCVFDTLSFVASQPAGSSITFDYRVPGSQLGSMDRFAVDLIEQEIAALGEPWLSSFEPEQLLLKLQELGFSQVEDPGPEAMNATVRLNYSHAPARANDVPGFSSSRFRR
jgi:O-methyltransferase involved in polyketide biosynthesis